MFTHVSNDFTALLLLSNCSQLAGLCPGCLVLVATDDAISPLIPAGAVDALLRKLFEEDVQLLCLSSREGKCVHTRAVAGEIGRFSSTDARLRGVANSQCLSPDKLCGPGKPSGIATHFIQPAASEELEVITLGKQWWGENKQTLS